MRRMSAMARALLQCSCIVMEERVMVTYDVDGGLNRSDVCWRPSLVPHLHRTCSSLLFPPQARDLTPFEQHPRALANNVRLLDSSLTWTGFEYLCICTGGLHFESLFLTVTITSSQNVFSDKAEK